MAQRHNGAKAGSHGYEVPLHRLRVAASAGKAGHRAGSLGYEVPLPRRG